ncbi:MAG: glycosyltransferase [Bdellovibrionales bacterium]|nr:glycosyltransferase [Bdellovibrionales bacterium]
MHNQGMVAPVVVFAYNRPSHLFKTLSALKRNFLSEISEVFVFSDGPRNPQALEEVMKVRALVNGFSGFKSLTLFERDRNFGLAENVINGVSYMVEKFGRVIVLEDDMVTAPVFLRYMNEALDRYETNEQVISIHGYANPISHKIETSFFLKGADCWGWATWARGWKVFEKNGAKLLDEIETGNLKYEFNFQNSYDYFKMLKDQIAGRNNSWAIRWYASAFLQNKLTLYPPKSLVRNIGMDGSGTHCDPTSDYDVELASEVPPFPSKVIVDEEAFRKTVSFYKGLKPNLVMRILRKIRAKFKFA